MKCPQQIVHLLLAAALAVTGRLLAASPVISEFMASNSHSPHTLRDEDGAFSDWIEIHNPDTIPIDLNGWFLTDTATNKAKWKFPAIVLPPGGYLVVFASAKDRRDPARPLHTNFSLNSQGEYLGLVMPDQTTVAFEYAPSFPAQQPDVSYGLIPGPNGTPATPGFLSKPTPGAPNATAAAALPQTVGFSRTAGVFSSSFMLQLNGAAVNQRIRYVVTPASAGGTAPEPTAASPEYTGPIAISSSVLVQASVFSASDSIKGATTTSFYAKMGASLSGFTSKLPILVIDTLGSGPLVKDAPVQPSWLSSFTPTASGSSLLNASPEATSPLKTSVRGSSSATFPKNSYNLDFTGATGDKHEQAFLDLTASDHWALVGVWKYDLTQINNALIYSLSNQIGRWAPRVRFAEVFLNTTGNDVDSADYAGIYALTDRVEVGSDRVDLKSLDPGDLSPSAITGGYIIKIDAKSPDEIGWQTSHALPDTSSSVILISPKADSVAPAQVDYIRTYVQRMENALYADRATGWAQRTYLDYIDRASWVDHHILNTFAANPDAFVRSAYFNKDRNGRLRAGPVWDFDRALGSYWDERSFRWNIWSGLGATDVWQSGWWGLLATDPEFMQEWIDRWQALRRGELSNTSLISLVGSLSAQVGTEAAARDAARWPDNQSPYGSYSAQIEHMKGWVTLRARWIDDQFLRAPAAATANGFITFTAPTGAKLAYTLDGSDPRALGGEIAPNAILASAPVSLPANVNIHVRSYRVELRGTFPGSPWSSATGGEATSPLSPQSRIVNLSSRAVIGSGDNALFAGVVIADTESKRYLARAIGPGLAAFGATGIIADPQLKILSGNGAELFRNTGWETGVDAARMAGYDKSVGAFPLVTGVKDSALASALPSGSYNLQISTPSNQPGIGLVELYELDPNGRTANLSTRARVKAGNGALFGGFVVQGTAYKRMLIRAVGPTLASFGLTDALRDPVLAVYSGQTIVATNDRWELADNPAAIAAAGASVGAFTMAAKSDDAAVLITLPPGAYTVEVKGKSGTEGIALLEIYEIP